MNATNQLRLKILLPTEILFDGLVTKVIAEAQNGFFCLLPRHIDCVAALVPGILCFYVRQSPSENVASESDKGEKITVAENFVGIDSGVLIKCGDQVLVSTFNAVRTQNLDQLKETVEKQFLALDEQEQLARTALTHLEAATIRRFVELEVPNHG